MRIRHDGAVVVDKETRTNRLTHICHTAKTEVERIRDVPQDTLVAGSTWTRLRSSKKHRRFHADKISRDSKYITSLHRAKGSYVHTLLHMCS